MLRTATPNDVAAIASIKVSGWRSTYEGLVAPDVLEPLLDPQRQRDSIAAVVGHGDNVVLVAEHGPDVVGFALCIVDPGADPLLDSLHVLTAHRSRGIGRLLLGELARRLAASGYGTLTLDVVEGNTRACALYERLGGRLVGRHVAEWADSVFEVTYHWDDLGGLCDLR